MTILKISEGLISWAAKGGYGYSIEEGSGDAVFWTESGGELRYFVRQGDDGWILLTSASRASSEQFELSAVSVEILERYLYSLFGADIRQRTGLRRLKIGTRPSFLAGDCTLSDLDDGGYRTLLFRDTAVARATDAVSSVSKLTKLSQLLTAEIEEIRTSFLADDGGPLFGT